MQSLRVLAEDVAGLSEITFEGCDHCRENPQEQAGYLAWSILAEPGDAAAAALIAGLGAYSAAEAVCSGASATQLADLVRERHPLLSFESLERALGFALERYRPRAAQLAPGFLLRVARSHGMQLITNHCDRWPVRLNDLESASPLMLWVLGQPQAFNFERPVVTLVGSRLATPYGERVAAELTESLAAAGVSVVSGGALGIDSAAHRAALSSDAGGFAVLAGGLDQLYPDANRELFGRLKTRQALIAEVRPGVRPTKWRFLLRNRLLAAFADAVVLVEAAARSGAVSTVNRAIELGRPCFAVPGSFFSEQSYGCHDLISRGAVRLLADPQQLLRELGMASLDLMVSDAELSPDETQAFDAVGLRPRQPLHIAKVSGLSELQVMLALGGLKNRGLVQELETGWRRLVVK